MVTYVVLIKILLILCILYLIGWLFIIKYMDNTDYEIKKIKEKLKYHQKMNKNN